MQSSARESVSGHVTLLFSVHSDDERTDWQGSRGAGICVEAGVDVTLARSAGSGIVTVRFTEQLAEQGSSEIYREVVRQAGELIDLPSMSDWDFKVVSGLPFGQGFGCSAAGALAAARALLECCGRDDETLFIDAMRIAHRVERSLSSGLGDVAALSVGGVELRVQAGLPLSPAPGIVLGWSSDAPVLLCWRVEGQRHTSSYIDDPDWKRSISRAGDECVDRLMQDDWTSDVWASLLAEADVFAVASGLLEDSGRTRLLADVQGLLVSLDMADDWAVRLCMLGSSAVILPRRIDAPGAGLDYLRERLGEVGLEGCATRICSPPTRR